MAAVLGVAAFIIVKWLAAGAPIVRPGLVPLQPDARLPTFEERTRTGIGIRKA
jgi:hypothetical protein